MMNKINRKKIEEYRGSVGRMGRREFTLHKMIEYGFWPKGLPTPFERQLNETPEQYQERQRLFSDIIAEEITKSIRKRMK